MAQEIDIIAFVEGIFGAALSQVIEEEKAKYEYNACTDYVLVAGEVFYAIRSACISISDGMLRGCWQERYQKNPDDPELKQVAEMKQKMCDKKLLWQIGFTPAMEREAYRQIMQEELAYRKCTETLMAEDEDSRSRSRNRMYFQNAKYVHLYVDELKKHYLRNAKSEADLDGYWEGTDALMEELTQGDSHCCQTEISTQELVPDNSQDTSSEKLLSLADLGNISKKAMAAWEAYGFDHAKDKYFHCWIAVQTSEGTIRLTDRGEDSNKTKVVCEDVSAFIDWLEQESDEHDFMFFMYSPDAK